MVTRPTLSTAISALTDYVPLIICTRMRARRKNCATAGVHVRVGLSFFWKKTVELLYEQLGSTMK